MDLCRTIGPALETQADRIMEVIGAARKIMRSNGNMNQWTGGYPTRETILSDISNGNGYVVEDKGRIVGYFAFVPSPEPTYARIFEGQWLNDTLPYHVVHRIASLPNAHGVFSSIMDWCFRKDPNIRIDTHRDNRIMQHVILKTGFSYCGIIYLESGDERLAYQKIIRNR